MIIDKLRNLFDSTSLVAPGCSIMVAFSGGPDSTVLLHSLLTIREEFDLTLSAAHMNHSLRGSSSDGDQLFCFQFCQALDIPFRSEKIDVMAKVRHQNGNLEETARELRYEFLQRAAGELGADLTATAHTMDDQAETIVQRLVRGSGLAGLRGIPQRRGSIIRPFLDIKKEEIESYLQEQGLSCRHDEHNDDPGFSRVYIRREIMPRLRELNPSLLETLSQASTIWAAEDDLLDDIASGITRSISETRTDGSLELPLEEFTEQHEALQRRIIRRVFLMLRGDLLALEARQVEVARQVATGGPAAVMNGISVSADAQYLRFALVTAENRAEEFEIRHTPPGKIIIPAIGRRFTTRFVDAAQISDARGIAGPRRALLDAAQIQGEIVVRPWREGDKYRQTGAEGRQKLQDIFVNAKLSAEEKSNHPVFESEGTILWVYGFRIAEESKVRESTRQILIIEEEDRDETI